MLEFLMFVLFIGGVAFVLNLLAYIAGRASIFTRRRPQAEDATKKKAGDDSLGWLLPSDHSDIDPND